MKTASSKRKRGHLEQRGGQRRAAAGWCARRAGKRGTTKARPRICPNDANRLVPLNVSLSAPPGPSGSICPTCKRGYDATVKVCPHDKDDLMPYALYASRLALGSGAAGTPGMAVAAPRGKICRRAAAATKASWSFAERTGRLSCS